MISFVKCVSRQHVPAPPQRAARRARGGRVRVAAGRSGKRLVCRRADTQRRRAAIRPRRGRAPTASHARTASLRYLGKTRGKLCLARAAVVQHQYAQSGGRERDGSGWSAWCTGVHSLCKGHSMRLYSTDRRSIMPGCSLCAVSYAATAQRIAFLLQLSLLVQHHALMQQRQDASTADSNRNTHKHTRTASATTHHVCASFAAVMFEERRGADRVRALSAAWECCD